MATEHARSDDEKRQAVVFAARFRYQSQIFEHVDANGVALELFTGDKFAPLPSNVRPRLEPRERWDIWRAAVHSSWTDAQVNSYQYKHWCGAFALLCIKDAGLAPDAYWRDVRGFAFPEELELVTIPKPGHVLWYEKNQHYALCEEYDHKTGLMVTIDGNQGATLATPSIRRYTGRPVTGPKLIFSIDKFLKGAP